MQDRSYRLANKDDLNTLVELENSCFQTDKLSARSFKRWIQSEHAVLLLAQEKDQVAGYGLVWCHKGTRLARLYSLAVDPSMRGKGLARDLLGQLEKHAAKKGRLYMRLEVSKSNHGAIALYEQSGYRVFGEYSDYYGDHMDALRMQKQIRHSEIELESKKKIAWYQQTTEFTCGPAALMMAMRSQSPQFEMSQINELEIWREATTIFMTSGHGGCHPVGLALAAKQRGFQACVYINSQEPLFLDGVRAASKKEIMRVVHDHFIDQASKQNIEIHYSDINQTHIQQLLDDGYAVLMLISTYRLDGKKAPHWVMLTNMDEFCLYVHDPDLDNQQQPVDCQYLPIARDDFDKMSAFGSGRLKTIVAIRPC
ncbi:peptidase C39 family protein [Bermanella sp. WJH001]|uniref:peptidase C39 family protein n=1 Tax=Bermanella sp. WJH001 TaxID=3048005 RepID=UPI0024BE13C3|nr:peptidase C39 family protein [Bermanella sp. WJH001]MDJ1536803.1 peptidase C39 family protein [Bermanella sp. WJH001]